MPQHMCVRLMLQTCLDCARVECAVSKWNLCIVMSMTQIIADPHLRHRQLGHACSHV